MWLSQKNENCQGADHHQPSSQARAQKADTGLGISKKFPKTARILSRNHYQNILRSGSKLVGKTVIMDYRLGKAVCPRLGITVSKRYGKAHDRNRFKRVVREAFRLCYTYFPHDLEINVLPRPPHTSPTTQAIMDDLLLLVKKVNPTAFLIPLDTHTHAKS